MFLVYAENMKKSIKNLIKQLSFLKHLITKHPQAEIYLVGGTVRDLLLKKQITDIDLVVRGIKASELEKFLKQHGTVRLVGKRFGVFKFRAPCSTALELYSFTADIALPRTDHAWGTGKYQDVEVQSDPNLRIEDDLKRRDFTINAMAVSLVETQNFVSLQIRLKIY